MSVAPSWLSSRSSAVTSAPLVESRLPVGSSARSTRGRPATARATRGEALVVAGRRAGGVATRVVGSPVRAGAIEAEADGGGPVGGVGVGERGVGPGRGAGGAVRAPLRTGTVGEDHPVREHLG